MVFAMVRMRQLRVGLVLFALMAGLSLAAPLLNGHDPDAQPAPAANRYLEPSAQHWFGTDQFGRDVFARVCYGGRISLILAVLVVAASLLIGCSYGTVSGYLGGVWDQVMMRLVDILLAFPLVFLAVTCMALFGAGIYGLVMILTLTAWMDIARLVRAEVLSLKLRPFVVKARAAGLSSRRIMLRHLLPNALATIVAVAVIRIADIILIESALSFLGLGVQPPLASWGSIINDGRAVLSSSWWLSVFPGAAIALTTISLHLIGEGLRMRTVSR